MSGDGKKANMPMTFMPTASNRDGVNVYQKANGATKVFILNQALAEWLARRNQ